MTELYNIGDLDKDYISKLISGHNKRKEYVNSYYIKNKDSILEKRKEKYINNKLDEEYVKKKKEYNKQYYLKKKNQNKKDNIIQ
jgi:hypothetical protein